MATCEVGLNTNACEAPPGIASGAGYADGSGYSIRTKCYRCGASACKGCSRLHIVDGKRIRICNDCVGRYQE